MNTDWVLDVLADLKTFARANDMPALAEQLEDAAIVAMAEIAATKGAKDGQCSKLTPRLVHADFGAGGRR